jgi:trimethylamine:corrinoid methyltransferase-like protein
MNTNMIGSLQEVIQARYDELKVNAYVHQEQFEDHLNSRQLKDAKIHYAESVIYHSQANAILDMMEIMFGISDDQKAERKENFRIIERNLVRVEALRHELSQTARAI